jgi:hypothetical protein
MACTERIRLDVRDDEAGGNMGIMIVPTRCENGDHNGILFDVKTSETVAHHAPLESPTT